MSTMTPRDAQRRVAVLRERFRIPAAPCPVCGADEIRRVQYGRVVGPLFAEAERLGVVRLAGCAVSPGSPTLECGRCGHPIEAYASRDGA